MWQTIEGKGPIIMMVSGKSKSGLKMLFGGYSSKNLPTLPESPNFDTEYAVFCTKEDFLFCYVET